MVISGCRPRLLRIFTSSSRDPNTRVLRSFIMLALVVQLPRFRKSAGMQTQTIQGSTTKLSHLITTTTQSTTRIASRALEQIDRNESSR